MPIKISSIYQRAKSVKGKCTTGQFEGEPHLGSQNQRLKEPHLRRTIVFILNLEQFSHLVLVFQLPTLKR